MDQDDAVFKALADPNRRTLLDALFQRSGQSLIELSGLLDMTRYGVMKHLQVLEDAGLITSEKVGREKHHYLNPVPVQMVYERWVSRYTGTWAQTLTGLKEIMEGSAMADKHVMQIFIRTSAERLWQALTEGDLTRQYYFGSAVVGDWRPGGQYHYPHPAGGNYIEGEVLEIDPPNRLVMSFRPIWMKQGESQMPESRVTWLIEPEGAACKLTLQHEQIDLAQAEAAGIIEGWARIISGLKTLLETGQPLPMGES